MATNLETSRAAELYERALRVLPGGVSRNTVLRDPHPAYLDRAHGCRIVDTDGVERIDFANNMASLIHGHAYAPIVEAAAAQLARGSACTLATEVEILFAEHLVSRCPSFEKLRFVNSGTEATMVALKAARAFTGRPKIAKVEGAYHGAYDYAEVSQESGPDTWGDAHRPARVPLVHGTPQAALDDVVVIPFNDVERTLALLDEHAGDLACVLIDLMPHRAGLITADSAYVRALRDWTERNGALLVFDEIITFRTEVGGLQARYDAAPDLTAMGKMIGGGFPIGAVAGRADVMDVMNPRREGRLLFPHAGTFSANPMSLTAGLVAMQHFDAAAVSRLNALADRAIAGIEQAIRETGVAACVTGAGSMFRVHVKAEAPRNYRDAYSGPDDKRRLKMLLDHLFDHGCLMINSCSATLSTPMTEVEIDALVDAMAGGFERIASA